MSLETVAASVAKKPPAEQIRELEKVTDFAKAKWRAGDKTAAVGAMDFAARLVTALRERGTAPKVWGRPFHDLEDGA
jgi:hypothetical protein